MPEQELNCLAAADEMSRPVHALPADRLEPFLAELPGPQASFLRQSGFRAESGALCLIPGGEGVAAAVLGLGGESGSPWPFGVLPYALPEGAWRYAPGEHDAAAATLGFCLGAYRYGPKRANARAPARLVVPAGLERALGAARAAWMVRDLINEPANRLGPAELAGAAQALAGAYGAAARVIEGAALAEAYPAVASVGAGSDRAPRVVVLTWRGSSADDASPLVSLCGKGVCFDSGGYDIKPSAGMLRMKKDMGGAAVALGLARMIMEADLPLRLAVRIGCVENSVSGRAMRPLDVLTTRRGLTVEVGNTDAEGRLVLCDLLAEACEEQPSLLLDFATLTGAARVALGPDIPALFCNDDTLAGELVAAAAAAHDPLWRLPLWPGYRSWLDSGAADLSNVSSKPFAGAIIAALFLESFVTRGTSWAHVDLYAWNDQGRPGRPEGGEAQAMFGLFGAVSQRFHLPAKNQNSEVT